MNPVDRGKLVYWYATPDGCGCILGQAFGMTPYCGIGAVIQISCADRNVFGKITKMLLAGTDRAANEARAMKLLPGLVFKGVYRD